jgi:VanZ family protein
VPKLRILVKYWLPPAILMAMIFSASADPQSYQHSARIFGLFGPLLHWLFPQMPPAQIDEIHYLFRKCAHLTEYAVLALLFWRALRQPVKNERCPPVAPKRTAGGWNWPQARLALLMVMLNAATDEFHQGFVPARTALVSDVIIDTVGGAVALSLLWMLGRLRKRW